MADALPGISGPERLVVRQSSPWGAFGRAAMRLKPVRFSLVNTANAPVSVAALACDPLQRAGDGAVVAAQLSVDAASGAGGVEIPPGGAGLFDLAGEAPARPGAYKSNIRIRLANGGGATIPISVEIPASPRLGIACMLLGLFSVGLIKTLAGEGAVNGRLHEALASREAAHALLEANPPPQARAGEVEAMDRDFDAAVAALGERRQLSIIDHREADAAEHLKTANAIAEQLRRDLGANPRGAAEIADLAKEWTNLQDTLKQVASLPAAPSAAPSPGLAGKLDAFLIRYRVRFLQQPIGWMSDEIGSELDRVRLAYEAGEGETARGLAVTTRGWLRRSARALSSGLVGYRGALVLSGSMVAADAAIRARLARNDLPEPARLGVLALLDGAAAKMNGDAWLPEWAEAHHDVNLAKTALVRITSETMNARFDDVIKQVNAATDTGDVDQRIEELQASQDHSLSAKQAGLLGVLDLWRRHVNGVTDPTTRKTFEVRIDQLSKIVQSGDLKQTGPLYGALGDAWVAWNARLMNDARDRLDHQQCLDAFGDLQREAGAIEASLRERPPGPELERWDRQLDQLRLDMQRQGPDAETVSKDCMAPLLALGSRAIDLSGEILTANIVDLQVPAQTRTRLAKTSGLAAAMAATEANEDQARGLDLLIVTPPEDRVTARPITLAVGRMDPVWSAGVRLGVAFGDGSPPLIATAEQIRQGLAINHVYGAPVTAHLSVVAAQEFKPGGVEPVDQALGVGETTLLIAPSQVGRARRIADDFLNLRFGTALLIALVVYYWRYHSKTAIFGAKGFDYVEAFVLGFAANAAVDTLPEVLAKFGAG